MEGILSIPKSRVSFASSLPEGRLGAVSAPFCTAYKFALPIHLELTELETDLCRIRVVGSWPWLLGEKLGWVRGCSALEKSLALH